MSIRPVLHRRITWMLFWSTVLSLCPLSGMGTVQKAQAAAGINRTIHYQGKVSLAAGSPVTNGSYNMRFRIYAASSGGAQLWSETWDSNTTRVTMTGGLFSVALGTHVTMTGSVDFNSDSLYLQIEFDPGNDGNFEEVFSPRRRFASVPYAHNAERLTGLLASQFLRNDQAGTASGKITIKNAGVGLNVTGVASGKILQAQDTLASSGNLVVRGTSLFQNNIAVRGALSGASLTVMHGTSYLMGMVGIGTALPKTKLEVLGTISGSALTIANGAESYVMGNLGIGIQNPDGQLHIAGQTATSIIDYTSVGEMQFRDTATQKWGLGVIGDNNGSGHANDFYLYQYADASDNSVGQYRMFMNSSGNLAIGKPFSKAKLDVLGTISGSALTVSSLKSCSSLQTSTAGALACGSGSFDQSATDARYVRRSGSTMTGGLLIMNGGAGSQTIDAGLLLEVVGTASGRILHAQDELRGSGSLNVSTAKNIDMATIYARNDAYTNTILTLKTDNEDVAGNGPFDFLNLIDDANGTPGTVLRILSTGEILGGTTGMPLMLTSTHSVNINLDSDNSGTGDYFAVRKDGSHINGDIAFIVKDMGNNINVGINVTAPASQLAVSGAVVIGNNITTQAAKTALEVIGTISGSLLTVTALKSCSSLQTSASGAFACGSAGAFDQTAADARYVKRQGSTMTGGLLIMSGGAGTQTIDADLLLEIVGTASGRTLHAQDALTSSGKIVLENAANGGAVSMRSGTGDPNGTLTGTLGSLFFATDTGKIWKNNNGSTQWAEIATGSGTVHMASINRAAAQSLIQNYAQKIYFDTEAFDVGNIANVVAGTTGSGRITIAKGGRYLVTMGAWFSSLTDGGYGEVSVWKNGSTRVAARSVFTGAAGSVSASLTEIIDLAAGDYLEGKIHTNVSGVTTVTTAELRPILSVSQLDGIAGAGGGGSLDTAAADSRYVKRQGSTMTGGLLIMNGGAGTQTIDADSLLEIVGTASGRTLHAQDALTSSGKIVLENAANGGAVSMRSGTGDPNGSITGTLGSLFFATDTGKIWKNNNGSTQWAEIATGSGTVHMAKMRRDAAQSILSAMWQKIYFDAEEFDVGNIANVAAGASGSGRITISRAGKYLISAGAAIQGLDAGEQLYLGIGMNSVSPPFDLQKIVRTNSAAADQVMDTSISEVLNLAAGDYIEFYLYHNEGAAQNTLTNTYNKPRLSVVQLDGIAGAGGGGSLDTAAADSRYVKRQGSTMTGGLLIMSGGAGTQTIDADLLLEIVGTASGRTLHAQDALTSSGKIVLENAANGGAVSMRSGTGDPNGSVTGTLGSLFFATDTGKIWKNNNGSTQWAELATGSGTVHMAKINRTAVQTMPVGWQKLYFDTEEFDVGNIANVAAGASGSGRITISRAGKYLISAGMGLQSFDSGESLAMAIMKNGYTPSTFTKIVTTYSAAASQELRSEITEVLDLAVGDYIEIAVYQTSGASQSTLTSTYNKPRLSVVQLDGIAGAGGGGSLDTAAADSRYVKRQGSTMTGGLLIMSGGAGTQTIDADLLLEIVGTASGRTLHAQDALTSSGKIVLENAANGGAISMRSGTGDPNGTLTGTLGSLFFATDTGKIWKNNNGSTQWAEIMTGSGTLHTARLARTSAQTVLSGMLQKIYLNIETYDTGNIGNIAAGSTGSGRITIRKAGKYLVTGHVQVATLDTGEYMYAYLLKNGVGVVSNINISGGATFTMTQEVTETFDLVAGDYIELATYHVNGASSLVTGQLSIAQIDGAASGSPWTDDGSVTYLTDTTDSVAIGAVTVDTNVKLEVIGTMSGRVLHAQDLLRSSGALVVKGTARFQSGAYIGGHLIPLTTNAYDLGTNTNRFRDLYLSGSSLHIGNSTQEGKIGYRSSGFEGLTFYGSGGAVNPAMLISSGGLVGIGTSRPDAPLHVVTAGSRRAQLVLHSPAGTADQSIAFAGNDTQWNIGQDESDSGKLKFSTNTSGDVGLSTLMTMTSTQVGIGTSVPGAELNITSTDGGQVDVVLDSGTDANSNLWFREGTTPKWVFSANNSNDRFHLLDSDTSHGVYIDQNTTSWLAASDARLKEHVEGLSVLDRINNFRAVGFDWKSTGTHDIGVIAQELYDVFPEVVSKGSESGSVLSVTDPGAWGVMYDKLGVLALQGVKELNQKLNAMGAGGSGLTVTLPTAQTSQTALQILTNVGGTGNTVLRADASGNVYSDGTFTGGGADYAEWFLSSAKRMQYGEAVCVDTARSNTVTRCTRSGDANIIGVVSSEKQAAFIGNKFAGAEGLPVPNTVLVGLVGQLSANMIVESGASIRAGDALAAASVPGFLRKAEAGEASVGIALEELLSGQGVRKILISPRNRSLTAETVSERVEQSIAAMNIGDDVQEKVRDAVTNLGTDGTLLRQVEDQIETLGIDDRIAALEKKLASGSALKAQTGTTIVRHEAMGPNLSLSGSLRAVDILASTLSVDSTLTVGSDARIAGDLYIEGTLNMSSLFIPGIVTIDGALWSNTLEIASGATIKGPLDIYHSIQLHSGATLTFATGATLDAGSLIVREALHVLGPVTIAGLASFLGDVNVYGTLAVSSRQAGFVTVPKTGSSVTVTFTHPFATLPVVNVTPNGRVGAEWWVDDVTSSGFTVRTGWYVKDAVQFSWFAVGIVETSASGDLLMDTLPPRTEVSEPESLPWSDTGSDDVTVPEDMNVSSASSSSEAASSEAASSSSAASESIVSDAVSSESSSSESVLSEPAASASSSSESAPPEAPSDTDAAIPEADIVPAELPAEPAVEESAPVEPAPVEPAPPAETLPAFESTP